MQLLDLGRPRTLRIFMDTSQRLQVEVHFTPTASGGRKTSVDLTTGSYRPHLITESSELLGVVFVQSTPAVAQPGDTAVAIVALMYPGVDYSALVPGAGFRVVEGRQVVATGRVLISKQA
jgi:translation elongation factor EF-Tu-like GTPase